MFDHFRLFPDKIIITLNHAMQNKIIISLYKVKIGMFIKLDIFI